MPSPSPWTAMIVLLMVLRRLVYLLSLQWTLDAHLRWVFSMHWFAKTKTGQKDYQSICGSKRKRIPRTLLCTQIEQPQLYRQRPRYNTRVGTVIAL